MKLNRKETEAVEYLREWAQWGFPMRVDGSLPTDVLSCVRRICHVPTEISSRVLEEALASGPDMDYRSKNTRSFQLDASRRIKEAFGVV